jgi:hypothetical protein
MRPSNAVRTVWDAEAIDTSHLRLPANPENRYHPRQFGVHLGNPDFNRRAEGRARALDLRYRTVTELQRDRATTPAWGPNSRRVSDEFATKPGGRRTRTLVPESRLR